MNRSRHAAPASAASALEALAGQWRARAAELRAYGAEPNALAVERCAQDLEDALRTAAAEALTLEQAAAASGYATDSLARLIRQGKLRNVGRKGAPRVRRADLPTRPRRPALAAVDGAGATFSDLAREAIAAKGVR